MPITVRHRSARRDDTWVEWRPLKGLSAPATLRRRAAYAPFFRRHTAAPLTTHRAQVSRGPTRSAHDDPRSGPSPALLNLSAACSSESSKWTESGVVPQLRSRIIDAGQMNRATRGRAAGRRGARVELR